MHPILLEKLSAFCSLSFILTERKVFNPQDVFIAEMVGHPFHPFVVLRFADIKMTVVEVISFAVRCIEMESLCVV